VEIRVHFYSWFTDLTHCPETIVSLQPKSTIAELKTAVFEQFPKLSSVQNSMLIAVGVDYQASDYILREGDEVSLFPPVQGG
jgi:molybdopterin converting factor small subunit